MRSIIKYIGLLFFSGLILPFYNNTRLKQALPRPITAVIKPAQPQYANQQAVQLSIYQFITDTFLPVLKN